jgi:hypothetical protein
MYINYTSTVSILVFDHAVAVLRNTTKHYKTTTAACGGRQCRPATVCTSVRCSKSGSCVYTAIRSNLNRTCQLQLLDGQLAGGVCRLSPDPSLGAVCESEQLVVRAQSSIPSLDPLLSIANPHQLLRKTHQHALHPCMLCHRFMCQHQMPCKHVLQHCHV